MSELTREYNPSPSELDTEFDTFNKIAYDDWGGIVDKGIVLYERLARAGDSRKEAVSNKLREIANSIKESGAESPEPSAEFRVRIARALKGESNPV